MIFVYVTCANQKEAQKIGLALVKEKLAACVNFWPSGSIYNWRGKTIKDKEFVLLAKTLKENFEKIEKRIKELHSYRVPCIVALPIDKVSRLYFNWLKKEMK